MSQTPNPPRRRRSVARSLKLAFIALFAVATLTTLVVPRFAAEAGASAPGAGANNAGRTPANRPPEVAPIPLRNAAVGQRVFFGLGAIDDDDGDVRIELVQKPASAKYNEKTLTVDWTPRAADGPEGQFMMRVTELDRATGKSRGEAIRAFNIKITPDAAAFPPPPPFAPLEVDALVSVIDPERLAEANRQWPITKLFGRIADIEFASPKHEGKGAAATTGAHLFRDALKNLAKLHRNEEIDPDSAKFNRQWNAENWRLVAVRPRLNKKVFELRLVYRNLVAAEPVFLMPRMRIVRGKDPGRPEELRQKNNKTFAALLHETFFDGPDLKPFVANDKQKYGAALADFITKVVNYKDPADPNMQATFAALPHNARLGGGNKYDAQGRYLSGDGWGLGAMKVNVVERDGKKVLAFTSPFVDGFATSVKPTPDGKTFRPVPAPRFDKTSREFVAGWDALIDTDDRGNIAIPDEHDGTVTAGNFDTTSTARDHKLKFMVAETPLNDARRRLFEERGMTCMQCHVRNFDEGHYVKSVREPANFAKAGGAREIPRVFFIIIPTLHEGRPEFIRRQEEEQVGNLQGVFRDYLGVKVNIRSPLAGDWPFDTRIGRS